MQKFKWMVILWRVSVECMEYIGMDTRDDFISWLSLAKRMTLFDMASEIIVLRNREEWLNHRHHHYHHHRHCMEPDIETFIFWTNIAVYRIVKPEFIDFERMQLSGLNIQIRSQRKKFMERLYQLFFAILLMQQRRSEYNIHCFGREFEHKSSFNWLQGYLGTAALSWNRFI